MATSGNHDRSENPLRDPTPASGPADFHNDLLDELLWTLESLQQQSRDIGRLSTELRARLADMDREIAAQHPHEPDKPH